MPKFVYVDTDNPMDDLLPTAEVLQARKQAAGLDPHYNIRQAFNRATGLPEDSMAFHFLMSQDPWDDDWGN